MSKRIAMISEHASPLGVLGGVDSGGQNVYVGQLARNLAALGYEVDLFTRRDSDRLPEIAEWVSGIRIVHVPAGPPVFVRKEDMLPFMDDFSAYLQQFFRCQREAYGGPNFWANAGQPAVYYTDPYGRVQPGPGPGLIRQETSALDSRLDDFFKWRQDFCGDGVHAPN